MAERWPNTNGEQGRDEITKNEVEERSGLPDPGRTRERENVYRRAHARGSFVRTRSKATSWESKDDERYRRPEIPNRGERERKGQDDGGSGGEEGRGTTGINNNYWFEPLSVRDLSNLKITSEINYVRLISPGLRSVYRRAYNTKTGPLSFSRPPMRCDTIRGPPLSSFLSLLNPFPLLPSSVHLLTYEHPNRRYYAHHQFS